MSVRGWHLIRGEDHVLLSRRRPARFDIAVTTNLPPVRLVPLVHMVRQDIWRALHNLRGFAPVVEARIEEAAVFLKAGGQVVQRPVSVAQKDTLRAVLEDARNRERWIRCAR